MRGLHHLLEGEGLQRHLEMSEKVVLGWNGFQSLQLKLHMLTITDAV